MNTFYCEEDGVAPEEFKLAGKEGRLQTFTCIGWIDVDDYTYVRNGCKYRIKQGE